MVNHPKAQLAKMRALGIAIAMLLLIVGAGAALIMIGAEPQSLTPPVQEVELKAGIANITYDETGFQPKQITIAKGSTVNFTNKTQLSMWVASDPHPEHTDYPGLDAGVIAGDHIPPGNPSFSFKFDKPGKWRYHNHSVPEHRAEIIVK